MKSKNDGHIVFIVALMACAMLLTHMMESSQQANEAPLRTSLDQYTRN